MQEDDPAQGHQYAGRLSMMAGLLEPSDAWLQLCQPGFHTRLLLRTNSKILKTSERRGPLAPYLEHLFKSLPRTSDFVFASSRGAGHIVDARKALAAVLRHAEIEHLTPHGLRRSFSLLGEASGAPDGAVSQVMGHSPGTMTEHYRPRTLDGLRGPMAQIERFIIESAGVDFDFDAAAATAKTPLRRVV